MQICDISIKSRGFCVDAKGMRDADVFNSIIDPFPESRVSRSGVRERRRSSRAPLGVVALMLPDDADESHVPLILVVSNVSVSGVGLRSPVMFVRGRVYRLRIGTGPLCLTSRIRIVSSRERPDESFDVGARFI